MATLRNVGVVAGLLGVLASGGAARATDCCVLNPNFTLYRTSECSINGNVQTCAAIEKLQGNKPGLLSFLQDEVPGTPFPKGAFIYVCPIDPSDPLPASATSFVKDKSGDFSVDVTANLKFFAYFNQLIFQGTYDFSTQAEKSKDDFPMVFQINGTSGGTTNIRLIGLGKESYNAQAIADDNTQKVSGNVSGNVVGDPDNSNLYHGDPVVAEGHPVCTTNEVFDRD